MLVLPHSTAVSGGFFVTPPSTFLAAGIFFSSAPSNLYRAASFCFALRYLTGVIIPPMPFLLSRFQVGACSFLSDNLRWRRKSCRKRPIVRIEVQCLCVNELTWERALCVGPGHQPCLALMKYCRQRQRERQRECVCTYTLYFCWPCLNLCSSSPRTSNQTSYYPHK